MANDKKKLKRELGVYGVYFANLSAYNEGRMVGDWVYPLEYKSFKDFVKAIKEATKDGLEYADEIAVHDYDGFVDMGEYPSHASIYKLAHSLAESSLKDEIIIKYFEDTNNVFWLERKNDFYSNDYEELIDEIKNIEDNFISEYDSFQKYADEIADEKIFCQIPKEAQQFVFNHFDYDSYARDLELDYNVIDLDNHKVAIFHI